MDLILFCHPSFLPSQSMPRFAQMLRVSYAARGHRVEVWSPPPRFFRGVPRGRFEKWGGYIDQYLLFPIWVRAQLRRVSKSTLFVFCDQALGPWVPLVKDRPHVVHVHDLLALRSALGDIPENPTSLTGRIYQRYIRRGFRLGRHFISVSKKTREDLHRFGGVDALTSDVVYNGLSFPYSAMPREVSLEILRANVAEAPVNGFILHVGGGQWYKNPLGVVAIYGQYAANASQPLPLVWVGPEPASALRAAMEKLPAAARVICMRNLENETLQALYSTASAFLFPSMAEGFGWPIVEAQACGCPVITTDEPPMNDIAGEAACYLPRLKAADDREAWSRAGAAVLQGVLDETAPQKARRRELAEASVKRFASHKAIDQYLAIYAKILDGAEASGELRRHGRMTI